MEAAGFACPCLSPHARTKGIAVDPRIQAIEDLVGEIAREKKLDVMVRFEEVWKFAVRLPRVREALGIARGSPEELSRARKSLGHLLGRYSGAIVKGVYQFTRYDLSSHEGYAIKITKLSS